MTKYRVVIKGVFYGKNRTMPDWNNALAATGKHYQQGAKMKRDMQVVCVDAIRRQLRNLKLKNPIRITYIFFEADRRRDLGNITYADKVFEDALQVCGVLPNDNQEWVRELTFTMGNTDKQNPRIEIIIEELED